MIRLPKCFLLCGLIVNVIACAVNQARGRAAAVETFARRPSKVENLKRHFTRQFGRLRDIVEGPDKALYLLTSNRDGGGSPGPQDDRVLRVTFK